MEQELTMNPMGKGKSNDPQTRNGRTATETTTNDLKRSAASRNSTIRGGGTATTVTDQDHPMTKIGRTPTIVKNESFDPYYKIAVEEEHFLTELYSHEDEIHFVGFSPTLKHRKLIPVPLSGSKGEVQPGAGEEVFCTGGEDGQIVL
ncbi:hypothetical protein TrVE_jg6847 [Triparma verrucosa]|uniref:Uncharacterized protein n=1 Tax=Triparma verrucosa TaxID=1606542 RepID=A0A9W7ES49_9STRA|nr:hypothetical protein TrVE_jg6847 [Triparma verrucosa]